MIISLVDQLRTRLEERDTLERQKGESQKVRQTLEALNRLLPLAQNLRARVELAHDRLAPERAAFQGRLDTLRIEVEESKRAFPDDPLQVRAIKGIARRLQELSEEVDRAWGQYVNETIRPHADLYALVAMLPEVEAQQVEITALLAALRRQAEKAPLTPHALTAFDTKREQLAGRLDQLEGLSEAIRLFLSKVTAQQATLEDLSEEVLAWCRRGNRASTFRIAFRSQTRRP